MIQQDVKYIREHCKIIKTILILTSPAYRFTSPVSSRTRNYRSILQQFLRTRYCNKPLSSYPVTRIIFTISLTDKFFPHPYRLSFFYDNGTNMQISRETPTVKQLNFHRRLRVKELFCTTLGKR